MDERAFWQEILRAGCIIMKAIGARYLGKQVNVTIR
jgi:hypothetical protein